MKRKRLLLVLVISVMLTLTGCAQDKLNVVVTSYPLQFLVERIAGDRVNVKRLDSGGVAQRTTIADDYTAILKEADVIFYINEVQPYFELYDAEIKGSSAQRVDLSSYSKLYDFKRYFNIHLQGQWQTIEGPYYDTPLLNNYDMYESDPILWIDPIAMTSMGRSVLDWLVKNYPDEATYFNDSFEQLEVELVRLYAEYQKLRQIENQINFVSLTPSFGNWQKSYGINVYPLVLSKYGVLPDDDLLDVYRERIQVDGVQYIAYEENLPEDYIKLFNQIKTELKLTQINLHNLYNLSQNDLDNNENYIDLMYKNLEALMSLGEITENETE